MTKKLKFSQARQFRRQVVKNGGQTTAPERPVRDPATGRFPGFTIKFTLDQSRNA